MKRYFVFLLIFILIPFAVQSRKKVAVVLSGGGAKGMAHIGALKIIDESGIPVDFVVGTSMGAIVGGLYSIGYTPYQLDSMVNKQDWKLLLSDGIRRSDQSYVEKERAEKYVLSVPFTKKPSDILKAGVIEGLNLDILFSDLTVGYHDSISFNRLPIPFACVSENVVNGDEVVFHEGILAKAMRASMAIPAVFTPVRVNGMVLVDGGMKNNFPVNVAREMGADIIIGVDVQSGLKDGSELNTVPYILGHIIDLLGIKNYEENIKNTTVYMKVDVEGYSAASFTIPAIDTLIQRGEKAARDKWNDLLAVKQQLGLDSSYMANRPGPFVPYAGSDSFYINKIIFDGLSGNNGEWLMKKSGLRQDNKNTMEQIQNALSILAGTQSYQDINYELISVPDGYDLRFDVKSRRTSTLNLGVRVNNEEVAAILLNATLQLKTETPSSVSATCRLGKRSLGKIDFSVQPWLDKNFNFSYMFQYNDVNIYNRGKRAYNTTYKYNQGEISYFVYLYRMIKFSAGLRFEHYNYNNMIGGDLKVKPEGFLGYFTGLNYLTYNKRSFPTKGTMSEITYSLYTDNMIHYKGHAPFSALSGSWTSVYSLNRRFAIIPSVYGRILFGTDVPYPYRNALGGDIYGHYVPQQLPFAGINYLEMVDNSVLVIRTKFRQRLWPKNYVSLILNYGITQNDFLKLWDGEHLFGGSIGYGYDSIAGPLEISFGYSNRTHKVGFYLNLGYVF